MIFVYRFLLILSLFRHGISVPVPFNYYNDQDSQNQGPLVRDDITESNSYERFPRNSFSTPYNYLQQENRLFPRSHIYPGPKRTNRKHFHLFHLTTKHPNAVSYQVIQKPAAERTIAAPEKQLEDNSHSNAGVNNNHQYQSYHMQSYYQQPTAYQSPVSYRAIPKPAATRTIVAPEKQLEDNSHSNAGVNNNHQYQSYHMQSYYQQPTAYQSPVSYRAIPKPAATRTIVAPEKQLEDNSHSNAGVNNNHQYQSYHMQSYYQQPTAYQSPGYPNLNPPYGQTHVQDTTYQDILHEVSNPLQFPSNPTSYVNEQIAAQNDHSLEEAAKQFSLVSADMNNMELASLIIYPVPPLNYHGKVHKKKSKSKLKNNKERKKDKHKMSTLKFQSKPQPENKLLNKMMKSVKDKEEDDMDYDGSGSGDTWDEEDTSTTDDQGYTSNKRSKIPHKNETTFNSNNDKDKKDSSVDKDAKSDEVYESSGSGAQESEFGNGHINESDVKDDDFNEKKESQKSKSESEETNDEENSDPLKNEENDEGTGIQQSEFGSGYVDEHDVKDDDSDNKE